MPRIELDQMTTDVLDTLRAADSDRTTRVAYVSMLIHDLDAGRLVRTDTIPAPEPPTTAVDQILEDAVWRATQAYRDHRPGYGAFILTRAAMAVRILQLTQDTRTRAQLGASS